MKMELYPCILFKFLGLFFILADNCFFTELSGCLPRVDSFLSEPEITVGWPLLEPFRVPLPLLPGSQSHSGLVRLLDSWISAIVNLGESLALTKSDFLHLHISFTSLTKDMLQQFTTTTCPSWITGFCSLFCRFHQYTNMVLFFHLK